MKIIANITLQIIPYNSMLGEVLNDLVTIEFPEDTVKIFDIDSFSSWNSISTSTLEKFYEGLGCTAIWKSRYELITVLQSFLNQIPENNICRHRAAAQALSLDLYRNDRFRYDPDSYKPANNQAPNLSFLNSEHLSSKRPQATKTITPIRKPTKVQNNNTSNPIAEIWAQHKNDFESINSQEFVTFAKNLLSQRGIPEWLINHHLSFYKTSLL